MCNMHIMGIPEREEETEAIFKAVMTENFPQMNVRQQTTDPGSSVTGKKNHTEEFHIEISDHQR